MLWVYLSDPFALRPVEGGAHLRATTVAWEGKALLIAGASGSGKSSLALELMALGAGLVADDVTFLAGDEELVARAPETLPRAIEARGLGLIDVDLVAQARVAVALDLSRRTAARMPQVQKISLLGHSIPLLHRPASGPVPAMLLQYLKQASL
ncbi:MAG: serine kinase [Pseudomonadota bacterium]